MSSVDGRENSTNGFAVDEPGYDSGDEAIYRAFKDLKLGVKKKKSKKRPKNLETVIAGRESRTDVQDLINQYGRENVKRKMARLVSDGVFVNRCTAMRIFPNLYYITSEPSADPTGPSEAATGNEVPEMADPGGWTLEPESVEEAPAARDWPMEVNAEETPPADYGPVEVHVEDPPASDIGQ